MQITYLFLNKYIFFIIYIKIIQKHGKKINSTSLNNGKQNKKTDSTLPIYDYNLNPTRNNK
jgi:hypothetical protein